MYVSHGSEQKKQFGLCEFRLCSETCVKTVFLKRNVLSDLNRLPRFYSILGFLDYGSHYQDQGHCGPEEEQLPGKGWLELFCLFLGDSFSV